MKKEHIGLAGEMRVCAELLKKGYAASITFGNAKATDIIVTGDHGHYLRIEVKTSKNGRNFVTGYYPKYTDPAKRHPDLWISTFLTEISQRMGTGSSLRITRKWPKCNSS